MREELKETCFSDGTDKTEWIFFAGGTSWGGESGVVGQHKQPQTNRVNSWHGRI